MPAFFVPESLYAIFASNYLNTMKKHYLLTLFIGLFLSSMTSAQTYSAWGLAPNGTVYDTLFNYDDTLRFDFNTLQPGIYTNARLVVVTAGDFGDMSEYMSVYLPTDQLLATTNAHAQGDCSTDSTEMTIPMATVVAWGTSVSIYCVPSGDVDFLCVEQRVKMRLEYDFCPFGVPTTYADFSLNNTEICPLDGIQTLSGNIAGGTFSGTNISGNTFNPAGLPAGIYPITFTGTDAIGCTTSITKMIRVKSSLPAISQLVCENSTPTVATNSLAIYSTNMSLTPVIDTTNQFTFPAITQSPTVYYYAAYRDNSNFTLDSIYSTNSMTVDHNALSGDDRSGIAITDSTVYVIGDNGTAAYDLDLNPASGISYPILNDGLFSDLAALKLYTLYDSNTGTYPASSTPFNLNAIAELNADLTIGGSIIPLSQTISLSDNANPVMILSGFGHVIIGNGNSEFYRIELNDGSVTSLGNHNVNPYWSESWAIWGNAGFDGVDDIAYYRDNNTNNIVAYNFGTMTTTPLSTISDFSDLATMTYHPGNGRLYGHYEGNTGTFGGNSETLFYTDADATVTITGQGSTGCPNTITYTFNSVDLGPDTTVCNYNGALVLEAGFGYESYTWNGVNNNWNVFPAQATGTYSVEVVDASNCTISDEIVVTFDDCASIEEFNQSNFTIYPVPNNGIFTIALADQLDATSIEIVNMTGQVIYSIPAEQGISQFEVQISAAPGTYLVRLNSSTGSSERLIVIQ